MNAEIVRNDKGQIITAVAQDTNKNGTAGRPLKFPTVEILDEAINGWLAERIANNKPLTMSSLAVALDTDRITLLRYKERPEFSNSIRRVKQLCESYAEDQLFKDSGQVNGIMFALKNNFEAWVDKSEVDQKLTAEVTSKLETNITTAEGFAEYVKAKTLGEPIE